MLKVGDKVKDFTLTDDQGNEVTLSDHLGKKVVIYIYPKNNTPGCTKQACLFRDFHSEILDKGVVLYGISKDGVRSHKNFREKHNLPFSLLSDPNMEIINYLGALQERNAFGRTFLGPVRSTYVIDEKGYLEHVWMPANSGKNPEQVLKYLEDNIE